MSKNSLVASEESKQTYAWVTELQNEIEQLKAERDAALEQIMGLEKAAKHTIKKLRSHHLCRSGVGAIVANLEEVVNRRA
jgi:hypothetical protein